MNNISSQKGQILILVVLVIVGLLGLTALAVDGGQAFADRRFNQNASDTSALSGGASAAEYLEANHIYFSSFNCSSTSVLAAMQNAANAAILRAATRNFNIDTDVSDQHGVQIICVNTARDKHIDINVMISTITDTSFAQLITNQPLRNTVTAIVRIHPRQPLVFGNAIVALNPAGCQGHQNGLITFGTADATVTGGGMFTNGCLRYNGNADVTAINGGISYVVDLVGSPNDFNPPAQQVPDPLPSESFTVPPPDCNAPGAHDNVTDNQLRAMSPLAPGLYCVTGNTQINAHDTLEGHDVTIYFKDGHVRINGNATLHLDAPSWDPDPSPAIPGVLFMMAPTNTNEIIINGNSDSYFEGTILAIKNEIQINGTGNTHAYRTQIIGWNVEIGGTAELYVNFDENLQYLLPPVLDLLQ